MFISMVVEVGIVALFAVAVVVGVPLVSAALSKWAAVLSIVLSWVFRALSTFPAVVGAGVFPWIAVPAVAWAGALLIVSSSLFVPLVIWTGVVIITRVVVPATASTRMRPAVDL